MLIASQLTGSGFKVRCVLLTKIHAHYTTFLPKGEPVEYLVCSTILGRIKLWPKTRLLLSNLHSSQSFSLPMNFNLALHIFYKWKKKLQLYEGKINYLIPLPQSRAKNNQYEYSGVHIHSFHTKVDKHIYTYI